jgi:hypothetical protein
LEGGVPPDCADVIAALEATNPKKVEGIMGKLSPIIVEVSSNPLSPQQVMIKSP